jgi:hypothetical protein
MLLYFTFISSPILYFSFPIHEFGIIQSKLFPSYYFINYICGIFLLITFGWIHPLKQWNRSSYLKFVLLILMMALALIQGTWAGPHAAQILAVLHTAKHLHNQLAVNEASHQFATAHGISSLINLGMIIASSIYFYYTFRGTEV